VVVIEIACWVGVKIVEIEVAMLTLRFPLSREFDALRLSLLGVWVVTKGIVKSDCGFADRIEVAVMLRIFAWIGCYPKRVTR
jgi:hypothetical protein